MKSTALSLLSPESKQEFGALLLLDQLMRFDLLLHEKEDLLESVSLLEKEVAELKKGFFHSEEQEQQLGFEKDELSEAKEALTQVEKELKENESCRLNLALFEEDDQGLEALLNFMEQRGTLTVGSDNYYQVSAKGLEVYQHLVDQLEAYVVHFDVYAYVDLAEGTFGDPKTDLLEGDRWSDLRVAVAEQKGIDPYRVVFLALLSAESFYENPDWKFDLSMGTLFDEMEQIVQEQLSVEDLGYTDDEGRVAGKDVIRDIIEQGSMLATERRLQDQEVEEKAEAEPDEQVISTTYYW
ncbi:MAG: hypothetical protein H8E38_06285 [SAR324 cluster bacterium]|nr:hypothetical protein [SAR324 cluster bacterium]MBL7034955.1 hypothetical protein [SAR324 cluster bacterium]